jgi:hypothetical protein
VNNYVRYNVARLHLLEQKQSESLCNSSLGSQIPRLVTNPRQSLLKLL